MQVFMLNGVSFHHAWWTAILKKNQSHSCRIHSDFTHAGLWILRIPRTYYRTYPHFLAVKESIVHGLLLASGALIVHPNHTRPGLERQDSTSIDPVVRFNSIKLGYKFQFLIYERSSNLNIIPKLLFPCVKIADVCFNVSPNINNPNFSIIPVSC